MLTVSQLKPGLLHGGRLLSTSETWVVFSSTQIWVLMSTFYFQSIQPADTRDLPWDLQELEEAPSALWFMKMPIWATNLAGERRELHLRPVSISRCRQSWGDSELFPVSETEVESRAEALQQPGAATVAKAHLSFTSQPLQRRSWQIYSVLRTWWGLTRLHPFHDVHKPLLARMTGALTQHQGLNPCSSCLLHVSLVPHHPWQRKGETE